jgi:uncharacterized protein (DUF1330 family)
MLSASKNYSEMTELSRLCHRSSDDTYLRAGSAHFELKHGRESMMKRIFTSALCVMAGIAIGGLAVQGLHAQAKAPIFTVTEIDVHNVDAYVKEYVPVVQPLLKKGGGTLLAASLKVTALIGTAPKRVAINRWDSLAAAQAVYNSPEYKAAEAVGSKYATFRRYAVEGFPQ